MCACASDLRAQPPAVALQHPASSSHECRLLCSSRRGGRGAIVLNLRLVVSARASPARACVCSNWKLAPLLRHTRIHLRTRMRTPCALLSRRFSGRFSPATTMAASCLLVTACTLAVALPIAVDNRVRTNSQPGGVARSAAQARRHLFFG